MSDAVELAVAYVQVVTSLQGSQGKLAEELVPELGGAGDKAAQGFGDKFKSGLGKIDAGKATLALGAGVVAGFAGLYQVGATFDDLADTIRVGTGASGEALDGLIGVAEQVGANVPASFDKIGPTIADLNTRLGLSGDTLKTVASQYLEAGRVLGEDVDINKTTAAFSAFGIEGSRVEGAMDTLFRVSQSTGVGLNDLATSVQTNGAAMQGLGFSFEETAALAGVLDKSGLNAGATMKSMGKALVTLAKDGEQPQAAFQRVTGEISGLIAKGDEAAALDLAAQLFGTKGAPQMVQALKDGTLSAEALSAAMVGSGDTILGVGADTADFAESWQTVQNNAQLALEPLASAVFAALGETLKAMMPTLQAFGGWLAENQWVLGVVAGIIGTGLVVAFGLWTASIWASTIALLANPVTWIVVGIVALIAALVLLIANWDSVVSFITDVWGGFVEWLAGTWDSIVAGVTGFGAQVSSFFAGLWSGIVAGVAGFGAQVGSFFSGLWSGLVASVTGFGGQVSSFLSGLWSGIVSTATGAWNGFVGWIGGIPGRVLSALAGLGQLGAKALAWFGQVYSSATQKFGELVSWVSGVPGRVVSALGNLGSLLYGAGRAILEGFLRGLKSMWSGITSFVGGIADWIARNKGPLTYDRKLLIPHGRAIFEGLDEGLHDRVDRVYATVGDVAGEIADTVVRGAVEADYTISSAVPSLPQAPAQVVAPDGPDAQSSARLEQLLTQLLAAVVAGQQIVLDGRTLVGETTRRMSQSLSSSESGKSRAAGTAGLVVA